MQRWLTGNLQVMVENILKWVNDPSLLNTETLGQLKQALDESPYCQPVRILYLKNLYLLRHPDFFAELQHASVFIADRRHLFYYLAIKEELWNEVFEFYSRQKKQKSETASADTFAMIDSFLQDFAPNLLQPTANQPTQKAARMAIATQDYASLLVNEESPAGSGEEVKDEPKLKHHELIDEFINFASTGDSIRENLSVLKDEPEPEELPLAEDVNILDDDDLLTESLAKIYIKQKRYYRAIEIIRKLSLKYPEKSVYFADQIRFLEKLIYNVKKA
ncbi:tetratricopeptide repeat protein [Parabacteroides sp. FAFU027]|uniref:tetratricopeptide repeat protein n=1 Tax=Parabacteroides sp. FAFU027 TaxID=2922715 RepID=UPI001FAEC2EC|nr:tetratricopeptide repeat protein [Parabacteroides sp. FAFU027]